VATGLDIDAALTAEARMLATDRGDGLTSKSLREPRAAES
jgi:hypothetical protein